VAGAVGDFECALGAYIVAGGLISGELADASETASRWSYDRRTINPAESHFSTFPCVSIGVYTPLSTARWTADNALTKLEGWTDEEVPGRQALLAKAAAFAGYSLLLLGEGFCEAAIDNGPAMESVELFAAAEERFTKAITAAQAAGDNDLLNLAYVGRARSRLNRLDRAGAMADAALVPDGFVYLATADGTRDRRNNRVFAQNIAGRVVTVGSAYRNLTFAGVPDPRVAVVDSNQAAADQDTPWFVQTKYTDIASPIPMASWEEAQLIIAEATGGDVAVGIINVLHDRAGLPHYTPSAEAPIESQIVVERSRELFLEGQHLFDARRFGIQFVPDVGTPYPKGGSYGTLRCMPLPDVERLNNPNIPDTAT
jgi:hypothetical protein